jgi:hypothetical protein
MAQPGYRSQLSKNVGGAERPVEGPLVQAGYRSLLWFQGGGAARISPNRGDYGGPRSMLAFWMGGAALHYIPDWKREDVWFRVTGAEGRPFRERGRHPIDDEEILEFLQLWTAWNDIE